MRRKYTRFQNYCTNDREISHIIEFCCCIEQIKQYFWIWNNESRSFTWFLVGLSWKICCLWNLRIEMNLFVSHFDVLTNTRSFPNVFVDCVVLCWLKPTKLCRVVNIMLQIDTTLFEDVVDIKFVSWCKSIYTCFQNYRTNVREFLHDNEFCCWIEQIKQYFGFNIMSHVHLHGLWLVWVERFVVYQTYPLKSTFLIQNLKFWQIQGHFLTFLLIVLYLAKLKPTKLCRMFKIMLQIAKTLFVDDTDVEFVNGCELTYSRFQNYCTIVRELLHKCGFFLLNWTDKTIFLNLR